MESATARSGDAAAVISHVARKMPTHCFTKEVTFYFRLIEQGLRAALELQAG